MHSCLCIHFSSIRVEGTGECNFHSLAVGGRLTSSAAGLSAHGEELWDCGLMPGWLLRLPATSSPSLHIRVVVKYTAHPFRQQQLIMGVHLNVYGSGHLPVSKGDVQVHTPIESKWLVVSPRDFVCRLEVASL